MMPGYMDLRYRLQEDILSSLDVIDDTDKDSTAYSVGFGWRPMELRMEDAEHI